MKGNVDDCDGTTTEIPITKNIDGVEYISKFAHSVVCEDQKKTINKLESFVRMMDASGNFGAKNLLKEIEGGE